MVIASSVGKTRKVRPVATDSRMTRLRGTVALVFEKHLSASPELIREKTHDKRLRARLKELSVRGNRFLYLV